MSSLWGSKNDDSAKKGSGTATPQQNGDDPRTPPSRAVHTRRQQEAEERRPLLGDARRPPHSDGYLDPDDPAVCKNLEH